MVTVKVIYKDDGEPAKDQKVAVGIDGFWSGGTSSDEWTDAEGEAHFDITPGEGKVWVGRDIAFKGNIAGRVIVYI